MNELIAALQSELEGMRKDQSVMLAELFDAQNRKVRVHPWRELHDRMQARIGRLERIIEKEETHA